MTATKVVVGVPTYRRPADLATLLPLLLAQADALTDHHGHVLVVDNDPDGSARAVVERLGDDRVSYAHEPTPGIAAVRNRILDVATDDLGADLVAMIDDDERPEPGWLAALVRTWEQTGAALVAGRVVPEFGGPLDPWVAAGRFHTRHGFWPMDSWLDGFSRLGLIAADRSNGIVVYRDPTPSEMAAARLPDTQPF